MQQASRLDNLSFQWGRALRLTVQGASHAPQIRLQLEGFPGDKLLQLSTLTELMARRKPGKFFTTARAEEDCVHFDQGIQLETGLLRVTGETIVAHVNNQDPRPKDYGKLQLCRPGHADYTARIRYGEAYNLSGGGPFSGRMTVALTVAGALCLEYLRLFGIEIHAYISQLGAEHYASLASHEEASTQLNTLKSAECLPLLNQSEVPRLLGQIDELKRKQDSLGGEISCVVTGLAAGLGGPLFEGLEPQISSLLFSIPSVKSVSFGDIDCMLEAYGSEFNDQAKQYIQPERTGCLKDAVYQRVTNHAGGIEGGISNGMPLSFKLRCKPTPSIFKEQSVLDLGSRSIVQHSLQGRHDPSLVIRAVPVVEACCALALLDSIIFQDFKLTSSEDDCA